MRGPAQATAQTSIRTSGPLSAFDRQGMANLKHLDADDEQTVRQVAQQFEALFLEMLMRNLRSMAPQEGLLSSSQTQAWQAMHDQQLSIGMAGGGAGLGVANLLVRQLYRPPPEAGFPANGFPDGNFKGGPVPQRPPATVAAARPAQAVGDFPAPPQSEPTQSFASQPQQGFTDQTTGQLSTQPTTGDWSGPKRGARHQGAAFDGTPQDFLRRLWKSAGKYAAPLGLDPVLVLGQAALESGWGKNVIRHLDGRTSHNLFGVKADQGWSGDRVRVSTLEYSNGRLTRQWAPFRSYASPEAAFADYARLLSQPRYAEVLGAGSDVTAFSTALQAAGYATDPDYASKIEQIVRQDWVQREVARLQAME